MLSLDWYYLFCFEELFYDSMVIYLLLLGWVWSSTIKKKIIEFEIKLSMSIKILW